MNPNRHKMALLTWLLVYPLITVLLAALDPLLRDLALPLRSLTLTAIMVPTLVYLALPAATARLGPWLASAPKQSSAGISNNKPCPTRAPDRGAHRTIVATTPITRSSGLPTELSSWPRP